ncbi:hypermethylated in cancer 2 protein-like [Syngnathus scovelli]|uniref:hypermethylated in cancer 2 protein-like n=1 Tax=Syngnathus scovelli TaxID=161590 RepID=UPI0021106B6D|nr:zinc finger and BTB domain-containing protein 44-like [Syngnathus scovelli]
MEDVGRHAALLLASLNHQREQANLCDCVLRQRQDPAHLYPAHKCILAASSPVLANILSSTGSLVDLQAPCLAHSVLELVLDFIYTGVPPTTQSWQQYYDLLAAARLLEMEQLQEVLMNAPPMEVNDEDRASNEPFRTCRSHFLQDLDNGPELSRTEKRLGAREDQKYVLQFTAHVDHSSSSTSPSRCCGPVPVIRHSSRDAMFDLQVASWENTHQYRNKRIDDSHEIALVEDSSYAGSHCEDPSVRNDRCMNILEDNYETRTQQQVDSKTSESEPLVNIRNTKVTQQHVSDCMLHSGLSSQRCLHLPPSSSSQQSSDEEAGVSDSLEPEKQTSSHLLLDNTTEYEKVSVIGHSHTNKDNTGSSSNDANRLLVMREHVACKKAYTAPAMSDHIQASTSTPSTLRPARRPFQCLLCTHSFSQRGTLNRHMRTHLGVRPFPCPRCPMTFSRQYRVTEHMRVHQRGNGLTRDFTKAPTSSI